MVEVIILVLIIIYISKKKGKGNGINGLSNSVKNIEQNVLVKTSDKKIVKLKANCTIYVKDSQKYLEMNTKLNSSLYKSINKYYSNKSLSQIRTMEINQAVLKKDFLDRLEEYKEYINVGIIKVTFVGVESNGITNTDVINNFDENKPSIFESSVKFGDYKNDYSKVECIHKDEDDSIKTKSRVNIFGMMEEYLDNPIKENNNESKYNKYDDEDDDPIKNL